MRHYWLVNLLFGACNDDALHRIEQAATADVDLSVTPDVVDFGTSTTGTFLRRTVRLTNDGTSRLSIQSITIEGDDAFSAPGVVGPIALDAGATTTVDVVFRAERGPKIAFLEVVSDDPDEPVQTVVIRGESLSPRVGAADVDLGVIEACPATRLQVPITNSGTSTLHVRHVESTLPDELIVVGYPTQVAPGGSGLLLADARPGASGTAELIVHSDDPDGPLAIEVEWEMARELDPRWDGVDRVEVDGDASYTLPLRLDVDEAPPLDVTFVLDTSCSMAPALDAVRGSFLGIAASLSERFPGVSFGVATFEDYVALSRWDVDRPFRLVQAQTTDVDAVRIALASRTPLGRGGDIPESGFEAIHQALTGVGHDAPGNNTCDGWHRYDTPPFLSRPGDAFGGEVPGVGPGPLGSGGGMGYRDGADPVLVLVSDAPFQPSGPCGGATQSDAIADLVDTGAALILLEREWPYGDLVAAATAAGAVASSSPIAAEADDVLHAVVGGVSDVAGTYETGADDPFGAVTGWAPLQRDPEGVATAALLTAPPSQQCPYEVPVEAWINGPNGADRAAVVLVVRALD